MQSVIKFILFLLITSSQVQALDMPPMMPSFAPKKVIETPQFQQKKEEINININGLEISDFIKMVSRITNKNILVSFPIKGKIEYVSAKPIYKDEIYDLLITILENYGFTIIDTSNGFLNVVRSAEASQMNLPLDKQIELPQMITKTIKFEYAAAETTVNKIRHLLSKNAKLIISKENNSILVSDYPSNLTTLENIIKTLDIKDETTTQYTKVVQLKNTEAKMMVVTLNNVISKKVLKPGELRAAVTNDDNTNTMIITATEEDFKEISETIALLDAEREQVYVKAKIVEISENKSSEIGLKYGVSGGMANNSGLYTLGTTLTGKAIALNSEIGTLVKTPSLSQGLAVGVGLSLLAQNGATNTLSEPSILCVNNQESTIYVGKTESIKTGTTTATTGVATDSYTRQDIGLTLKIKPRVSNDNKVTLTAEAKLEDIENTNAGTGLPTTTKREVKTNAIVNSGESVIIGGLVKNKETKSGTKIPFLGDIPFLGALFRSKTEASDKTNLVLILTPYIIKSSDDLAKLNEQLAELDQIQNKIVKDIIEKEKKDKEEAK